jgi:methylmalonyl-CoA mutase, N-terminal domain
VERQEKVVVGVNRYQSEDQPIELLQIDETAEQAQREKLRSLRARRDNTAVNTALANLENAARSDANTMPPILEAVRAYATLGEICDVFRGVYGEWVED